MTGSGKANGASQPIQSRWLGRTLIVLGLLIALPGAMLFHSIVSFAKPLYRESPLYLAIYILLIACSVALGGGLVFIGRRLSRQSVEQALQHDPRSPIVYLRRFAADRPNLFGYMFDTVASLKPSKTDEEKLVSALSKIGPVRAIGTPGERLPTLGAIREYVEDDQWQRVVAERIKQAKMVLLRPGKSESLRWEIETVFKNLSHEKILLYFSPKGRQREYQSFRESFAPLFPVELPDELGKAQFLWFDEHGAPKPLTNRFGFLIYAPHVKALLPVYSHFGVQMPTRWLTIKSAILWSFGGILLLALPFMVIDLLTN